jgi:hypothetical protein
MNKMTVSTLGSLEVLMPNWKAAPHIHAFTTLRSGGFSKGPWGNADGINGFNTASHVGDDAADVEKNRKLLRKSLPDSPRWLSQVHGIRVVRAESAEEGTEADAVITTKPGTVCCIQTADCMPVLLTDENGTVAGAAHAGWRGLLSGVLQETVKQMRAAMPEPDAKLQAWLGPCIRKEAFEVGAEVVELFSASPMQRVVGEAVSEIRGKYHIDLPMIAFEALRLAGVDDVSDSGLCTFSDPEHFFSYRRDRVCGRHSTLIYFDRVL